MKDCGSCVHYDKILNWRLHGTSTKRDYRGLVNGGLCQYWDGRCNTDGKACQFHKRKKYKRIKKHNQKEQQYG